MNAPPRSLALVTSAALLASDGYRLRRPPAPYSNEPTEHERAKIAKAQAKRARKAAKLK